MITFPSWLIIHCSSSARLIFIIRCNHVTLDQIIKTQRLSQSCCKTSFWFLMCVELLRVRILGNTRDFLPKTKKILYEIIRIVLQACLILILQFIYFQFVLKWFYLYIIGVTFFVCFYLSIDHYTLVTVLVSLSYENMKKKNFLLNM